MVLKDYKSSENIVRIAFLSFLECEIRGPWQETTRVPAGAPETGLQKYHAGGDNCEIWLVRPDELRRAFHFKSGAVVAIGQMTVRFNQNDVSEELKVDEDERSGKPAHATVL